MENIISIQNRIYEIRGLRVMLDKDLAELYGTETKALNLAVKRNVERFPKDFMFQLTDLEFNLIKPEYRARSQTEVLRFQIETSKEKRGGTRYLPYAFTEQGVAMLSSVLNSAQAIKMNIAIMRAFVEIRRLLMENQLGIQLLELKKQLDNHDLQLSEINQAIENIIDQYAAKRRWDSRERIGFKK